MKTTLVEVRVTFVKLHVNENGANLSLELAEPIDGFKVNSLGEREFTQVNTVSVRVSDFAKALGDLDETFQMYYGCNGKLLDQDKWYKMMYQTTLVLKRNLLLVEEHDQIVNYKTGELEDVEKDQFLTEVTKVKFGKLAMFTFGQQGVIF